MATFRRFLFSFFSFSVFFLPTSAQEVKSPGSVVTKVRVNLTGKITDVKTGEALNGASIYFPDIKVGGITNEEGVFHLQHLPTGRYLVEVSHLGYASQIVPIDLKGDVIWNFELRPSVVESEAVTVTGVSAASTLRRSSVPVDILRKADLFNASSTNLIDALSKTPGVSQISTGPAISKPTIRGLGYNRLVVVNDGVRQEGQQWGDEHGIEIDEYSVSKVEVLKGPASIMYGSDALAGVINIITNVPVAEGALSGNIFTNYQSNNGLRGLHANVSGNENGFNWNIYGSVRSAHDYKNRYDGFVYNSRFNERNFGGYVGLNKGWGYTHLLVSNFNQRIGLVEGERDPVTGEFLKLINNAGIEEKIVVNEIENTSRTPAVPWQHVKHFKASLDNHINVGKNHLAVNIGFQRNQRMEFGNVVEPSERGLYFDLKTINYHVHYQIADQNNWQTSIGINGLRQHNDNKGAETLIPEYNMFDVGAFVYSKKSFENLTISSGLRIDHRSLSSKQLTEGATIKFPSLTKGYSNVSGSLGLSMEVSEAVTLKLNLARGFRAPSIPELSTNGAHEGTDRYEYGRANLKSETSLQLDAGLDINAEHVSLSANLFYNDMQHFIYYRKLASASSGDSVIMHNGNQYFAFQFNQDDARLYGAEFNLDLHPHPLDWLHIENTFTYVRGLLSEARDGSRNLPFIPAPRLINQVKADLWKKGKRFRNLNISAELDNTFAQQHPFTGYNTETATPRYSLVNASVGTDVNSRKGKRFSIFISANNVFDKAYQSHLSRLKYVDVNAITLRQGVFNMGRNYSVKLNVPLVFSKS